MVVFIAPGFITLKQSYFYTVDKSMFNSPGTLHAASGGGGGGTSLGMVVKGGKRGEKAPFPSSIAERRSCDIPPPFLPSLRRCLRLSSHPISGG